MGILTGGYRALGFLGFAGSSLAPRPFQHVSVVVNINKNSVKRVEGWQHPRETCETQRPASPVSPPNPPSCSLKKAMRGAAADLLTTNQHPFARNTLAMPHNSAAVTQERRRKGRWDMDKRTMEHTMNNATARPTPGGGLWPLPPLAGSPRS